MAYDDKYSLWVITLSGGHCWDFYPGTPPAM